MTENGSPFISVYSRYVTGATEIRINNEGEEERERKKYTKYTRGRNRDNKSTRSAMRRLQQPSPNVVCISPRLVRAPCVKRVSVNRTFESTRRSKETRNVLSSFEDFFASRAYLRCRSGRLSAYVTSVSFFTFVRFLSAFRPRCVRQSRVMWWSPLYEASAISPYLLIATQTRKNRAVALCHYYVFATSLFSH